MIASGKEILKACDVNAKVLLEAIRAICGSKFVTDTIWIPHMGCTAVEAIGHVAVSLGAAQEDVQSAIEGVPQCGAGET